MKIQFYTCMLCCMLFFCKPLLSQCTINWGGDTCLGQTLSVSLDPVEKIKSLAWSYNGHVVFSQPNLYSEYGVKVVGADTIGGIRDIYVDDNGNLYVNDWDNKRILKYAPGSSAGVQVATSLVVYLAGDHKLDIYDFCVYKDTVFLAEYSNVSTPDNRRPYYVTKWAPGDTAGHIIIGPGAAIPNEGIFTALTTDSNGVLYVAQTGNNKTKISKLAPGGTALDSVIWNTNALKAADDMHLDNAGNIYTLSRKDATVLKWMPGATNGEIVARGIPVPQSHSLYYNPKTFCLDSAGNIYLTVGLEQDINAPVTGTQQVLKFTPGQSKGDVLIGDDGIHTLFTSGVSLDRQLNLYVGDFGLNTVYKYPPANAHNKIYNSYKPRENGNYSVIVKGKSGCVASEKFTMGHSLFYPFISGPPSGFVCPGKVAGFYVSNPDATAHYNWDAGAFGTILSGQGTDSITATFTDFPTKVTVSVTASNHCTAVPITGSEDFKKRCTGGAVAAPGETQSVVAFAAVRAGIYPNPAHSNAALTWTAKANSAYTICVTDIYGKTVLVTKGTSYAGSNAANINTAALANAVYLVRLTYDNTIIQLKLTKQ